MNRAGFGRRWVFIFPSQRPSVLTLLLGLVERSAFSRTAGFSFGDAFVRAKTLVAHG